MNNNCKYFKIKLNRSFECKRQKKIINVKDCANCIYKEYKNAQNYDKIVRKVKPSKRTKSLAITKNVKMIVWERDNHECIFCHCKVPWNLANSHFIKRSHGGLGIPKNIFCACLDCHRDFDDTPKRAWMLPIARNYLIKKYSYWNEDMLIYKK